eukprot:4654442-Prymnesium_polylepis.1
MRNGTAVRQQVLADVTPSGLNRATCLQGNGRHAVPQTLNVDRNRPQKNSAKGSQVRRDVHILAALKPT